MVILFLVGSSGLTERSLIAARQQSKRRPKGGSAIRSLLVTFGFRGATSIILFAVIGVDLVPKQELSDNAVIVAIAAIIALHIEQLIAEADPIKVWKLFEYKKR